MSLWVTAWQHLSKVREVFSKVREVGLGPNGVCGSQYGSSYLSKVREVGKPGHRSDSLPSTLTIRDYSSLLKEKKKGWDESGRHSGKSFDHLRKNYRI